MSQEQNFWRLFNDYEGLTREQATAIAEWNHEALQIVHGKKAVILVELERIADLLGLDHNNPELMARWSRLVVAEQYNSAQMSENLAKARIESQLLNVATQRLKAIEHVYAGDTQWGSLVGSFSAQG